MTSLLRFAVVVLCASSALFAQTNSVSLNFHHMMGSEPFALNSTVRSLTGDYFIKPTSLRYYVTRMSITHDGGIVTPVGNLVLLVDLEGPQPYVLGQLPIITPESITFFVGIDSARNHLDPALYPPTNPLSPQNPTMHWGWEPGYKFIAYDGVTGIDSATMKKRFEIHALGDSNYRSITIPTTSTPVDGKLMIDVRADYAQLLHDIDVRNGLLWHGDDSVAATELQNVTNRVFSAFTTTSVRITADPTFTLAPLPASDVLYVYGMEEGGKAELIDVQGNVVVTMNTHETTVVDIHALAVGAYVLRYSLAGQMMGQRIVVRSGR
ncbi:hypothetical protein BH10BAC6_BH10BAC6_05890 [soil metagenome]